MGNFHIDLRKVVDDSYDIEIGFDLINKLVDDLESGLVKNVYKYAIVTDDTVEKLYADNLYKLMKDKGFNVDLIVFPAGEKSKTRKTKEYIEDEMLKRGYHRDSCIIAVGGGVVTDLAGFIAGTFGRGIPFINYATTILAAADASIGGKTAVDTELATNLIGLINQPSRVYIDINTWSTLPKKHIINGLAETIKHACISDKEFFEFLEENIHKVINEKGQAILDKDVCRKICEKNCEIKYDVVKKDENEKSLREVLNLGHTVGRAIETLSDYRLLHGEAVSIGMAAEVRLAEEFGYLTKEEADRVIRLYEKIGLPTSIPDNISREDLIKKLYTDKKVRKGKIRFVLQDKIGSIKTFGENQYARTVSEDIVLKILKNM